MMCRFATHQKGGFAACQEYKSLTPYSANNMGFYACGRIFNIVIYIILLCYVFGVKITDREAVFSLLQILPV